MAASKPYDLWYWTGIPGRGEFVRLSLEAGGIAYKDIAIEAGEEGMAKLSADLDRPRDTPSFAPPYLVVPSDSGTTTIGQTANILLYLGDKHGLAPTDIAGRLWANQVQLTIADMVVEAHDSHHPIGPGLYYEDQKPEAARRAEDFRRNRLPKYLGWFERVLARRGDWLAGKTWSYADLSLFHLIDGLRFAFPNAMARVERDTPKTSAVHDAVAALPELQAYFKSGRRQPFSNGLFRYYPELDPT